MMDNQQNWISESKKEHRELYSELDVLLRSVDRFFNIENINVSQNDLPAKNFFNEINSLRDVIYRILAIFEVIIPESKKNAYWFQKYAESKLFSDYTRDIFKEKLYNQDSPEKSIFLLYDLFINLKGIITELLKSGEIQYTSYVNIGQIISKEIRGNKLLNPFLVEINPDFDSISNPLIKEIVKKTTESEVRKIISLIYIYLFRFLRFLKHIDISSKNTISLNSSLLILIMLNSELSLFRTFLRRSIPKINNNDLKSLLNLLSYQFSMETKRVFSQELKDIFNAYNPEVLRGKIENSKGILNNLVEQSILQITQYFNKDTQGKDIFPNFVDKLSQSIRLREDIFTLHRFITLLEEQAAVPEVGRDVFKAMQNFIKDFQHSTSALLRYDDYNEFNNFFNEILSLHWLEQDRILKIAKSFKIYLETTLRNIANRSELKDISVDIDKVEANLKKYI